MALKSSSSLIVRASHGPEQLDPKNVATLGNFFFWPFRQQPHAAGGPCFRYDAFGLLNALGSDSQTLLLSFIYSAGTGPYYCEFQVWKRSKVGSLTLFLDSEANSPITTDSTPRASSPGTPFHLNHATSDSESTTDRDVPGEEEKPATEVGSPSDLARPLASGASPSASSVIVERALRSRVAYSERPSKVLPPSAHREDTIRMANVALCNERIYCTIDCMKGLKVQMLSIICIFRIGNKIFASGYTPFPPPSSLKRKERSRISRPKRSSPLRKDDPEDDDMDGDFGAMDEEGYTPAIHLASAPQGSHNAHLYSSSMSSSYASQSMQQAHSMLTGMDPTSRTRIAIPFGSGAGSVLPSTNGMMDGANGPSVVHSLISPDVLTAPSPYQMATVAVRATGPQSTATSVYHHQFASNAPNNATIHVPGLPVQTSASVANAMDTSKEKLGASSSSASAANDSPTHGRPSSWSLVNSRMKAIATTYAEHTLSAISRVAHLHAFLNNVPLASSLEDIAQWCLAGGVPIETKLVARVLDVLSLPCFVGPIEHARSFELLSASLMPHLSGIFLIRTIKDEPLALEIYGLYKAGSQPNSTSSAPAPTGAIQEYYATIRIQLGSDPHLPAFFWIDTEANAEESRCASLSSLVTYVSRVTGWSPIDRDCVQDPQLIMPSSVAANTSVPSQRVQSWTTLLDSNVLSQQYGLIPSDSSAFTSPYDMFTTPSASCYHPPSAGSSGLSFPHYGNGTRWTTE